MKRKKRGLLLAALMLLMLMSLAAAGAAAEPVQDKNAVKAEPLKTLFNDVKSSDNNAIFINYLADLKIMSGYPDGSFKAKEGLTRAQAAVVLAKAAGLQTPEDSQSGFADVKTDHWAAGAIAAAAQAGYLKGYPDGSYQPEEKLTRAQGIALVMRLSKQEKHDELPALKDMPKNHWAAADMATALNAGMIGLSEDKTEVHPEAIMTRGSLARALGTLLTRDPGLYTKTLAGTIKDITGEIKLTRNGTTTTLQNEAPVFKGDVISVGASATSNLVYPDGSSVLIKENTEFQIKESIGRAYIRQDGTSGIAVDNVNIDLKKGTLFGALATKQGTIPEKQQAQNGETLLASMDGLGYIAETAKTPPWYQQAEAKKVKMKVDMPYGVAAIRGTFILVTVNQDGSCNVSCLTGDAEVEGKSGGIIPLSGGKSSGINQGGTVAPQVPLTEKDKQEFSAVQQWVVNTALQIDQNKEAKVELVLEIPDQTMSPAQQAQNTIDVVLKALESSGIQLTEQVINELKEKLITISEQNPVPSSPSGSPGSEEPTVNYINYATVDGTFGPESSGNAQTISKNVIISAPGIKLRNMIISKDLTLAAGIGEGDVTLENVQVQGETKILGGGSNSVSIEGCELNNVSVEKSGVSINILNSSIGQMNIAASAGGSILNLGSGSSVNVLHINAAGVQVLGQGIINTAYINAAGLNMTQMPQNWTVAPGINDAIISGEIREGSSSNNVQLSNIGTISGTAEVGAELTAGELIPANATVTYQWQISDSADGTYADISGATGITYTPVAGDAGKFIRVVATGTGSFTGNVPSAAVYVAPQTCVYFDIDDKTLFLTGIVGDTSTSFDSSKITFTCDENTLTLTNGYERVDCAADLYAGTYYFAAEKQELYIMLSNDDAISMDTIDSSSDDDINFEKEFSISAAAGWNSSSSETINDLIISPMPYALAYGIENGTVEIIVSLLDNQGENIENAIPSDFVCNLDGNEFNCGQSPFYDFYADGSYAIECITGSGEHTLSSLHYQNKPVKFKVANEYLDAVTLLVTGGAVIIGTVRDESENPIAGVTVNAYEYWYDEQNEYEELYLPAIAGTVTDGNGEYSLLLPACPDEETPFIIRMMGNARRSSSAYYNVGCWADEETSQDVIMIADLAGPTDITISGQDSIDYEGLYLYASEPLSDQSWQNILNVIRQKTASVSGEWITGDPDALYLAVNFAGDRACLHYDYDGEPAQINSDFTIAKNLIEDMAGHSPEADIEIDSSSAEPPLIGVSMCEITAGQADNYEIWELPLSGYTDADGGDVMITITPIEGAAIEIPVTLTGDIASEDLYLAAQSIAESVSSIIYASYEFDYGYSDDVLVFNIAAKTLGVNGISSISLTDASEANPTGIIASTGICVLNGSVAVPEVNKLTVTAQGTAGNLKLVFEDGCYYIYQGIAITEEDSSADIAAKIYEAFAPDGESVIPGYTIDYTAATNEVLFTNTAGNDRQVIFYAEEVPDLSGTYLPEQPEGISFLDAGGFTESFSLNIYMNDIDGTIYYVVLDQPAALTFEDIVAGETGIESGSLVTDNLIYHDNSFYQENIEGTAGPYIGKIIYAVFVDADGTYSSRIQSAMIRQWC